MFESSLGYIAKSGLKKNAVLFKCDRQTEVLTPFSDDNNWNVVFFFSKCCHISYLFSYHRFALCLRIYKQTFGSSAKQGQDSRLLLHEMGIPEGECSSVQCRTFWSLQTYAIQEWLAAPSEIPLQFVLEIALNSVPSKAFLIAGMSQAKWQSCCSCFDSVLWTHIALLENILKYK